MKRKVSWELFSLAIAVCTACESGGNQTTDDASTVIIDTTSTGFAHYDWLPQSLKDTMEHLAYAHTDRHFNFYYYFTVDDINRHFFLEDAGLAVIAERPVVHEEALRFVDEQLYDPQARKWGEYYARDTTNWQNKSREENRWSYFKRNIFYILPQEEADFTQLRVAIVEDTTLKRHYEIRVPADPAVYSSSAVDQPAVPMRGMDYFREAIEHEVHSAEAFILYDTGTVEVTFEVWGGRARSPNLVRGLSTHHDTHAAYQADGEFIKAINNAKVWWRDARQDGQPVASTVRMTFDISELKESSP